MKKQLQRLSVILGLLLAVAIVFVQVAQFHASASSKKEASTEQRDTKKSGEDLQISLPSFSLPSPVSVSVNLDACFLFEITFQEKEEVQTSIVYRLIPEKFLSTLFSVIISPNAP
jgi:hypothetical protein